MAGDEPVRRSGQADGGAGADVDRGARHLAAGARAAAAGAAEKSALAEKADKDRRFAAPEWRDNPLFDTIRQTYLLISERLLGSVDAIEGVDEETREKMRFMTRAFVDAMTPVQFRADQPAGDRAGDGDQGREPAERASSICWSDLGKGQLTHVEPGAFEVGRNIATTPGKVVKQTRLYQLIQYAPATEQGAGDAADHLPALDQPLLHPRSQPEEELHQMGGRAGADRVRRLLEIGRREHGRRRRSTITCSPRSRRSTRCATRSASRACTRSAIASRGRCWRRRWRCSRRAGEADKVASATFFTAQVDFSEAGDLKLFIGDEQMELIRQLSADKGYLDGRYMAATFNLLRGRDLIWSYVTSNYLMGEDYPQFDLLFWNGDTTNLPANWHRAYLHPALPREPAGPAGRDHDRRHADRPADGEDADLRPGRPRGPYRAAAERLEDHPSFPGAAALRAGGLGPYRRRGQPARGGQIPILDQRGEGRHARRSSSPARPRPRAAGGPTGSAGSGASPRRRCSPRARACPARAG